MAELTADSKEMTTPTPAVRAYDAVVAKAELREIKLIGLNFNIKPKFFAEADLESSDKKAGSLNSTFESTFPTAFYDSKDSYLGGQINWSAVVKKGRSKIVSIEAVYLILYSGVPEVEEEHALAFLRRVGRFATYPYFRALVSRLSSESGLDLPILPVLK
jgi:hypothetical protein